MSEDFIGIPMAIEGWVRWERVSTWRARIAADVQPDIDSFAANRRQQRRADLELEQRMAVAAGNASRVAEIERILKNW